jgi:hypothetical protein
LESVIRKLRIQMLKAQLALRQHQCATLAEEFEAPTLSVKQRAVLADHRDVSLKESHVLQLMLDLLEMQENEALLEDDFIPATKHENNSRFSSVGQYHRLRIAWRSRSRKTGS